MPATLYGHGPVVPRGIGRGLTHAILLALFAGGCDSAPTSPEGLPPGAIVQTPSAVINDQATLSFDGTYLNYCPPEEYVEVAGPLHISSQTRFNNATGTVTVTTTENTQGVRGIGLTTGALYRVVQVYHHSEQTLVGPAFEADRLLKMRMVAEGSGADVEFQVIYTIRWDPVNGSVLTMKRLTIACRG
jgi:hypothetical protein